MFTSRLLQRCGCRVGSVVVGEDEFVHGAAVNFNISTSTGTSTGMRSERRRRSNARAHVEKGCGIKCAACIVARGDLQIISQHEQTNGNRARKRQQHCTLRRRSHAAVEANTGNIPSWLPSFESSCDAIVSQQRNATATRARTSVAGAREWMTPLVAPRASAVPKRTLLDSQGVVGSRKSLRRSILGLCGTCTAQRDQDDFIKTKKTVLLFRIAHLADHTA
jgi:hypothetical protein